MLQGRIGDLPLKGSERQKHRLFGRLPFPKVCWRKQQTESMTGALPYSAVQKFRSALTAPEFLNVFSENVASAKIRSAMYLPCLLSPLPHEQSCSLMQMTR